MCCIFTCCGWMIDLVQRLWTFTMSCCIMSAVCGVMVTTSMGGIALGYNYSLAEYIDLKETNVSVYLKRGVFDDEVADDMDWRRAGHLPVAGHLKDENLRTGMPEDDESTTIRSGRRLDDSLADGNDQQNFEGSLMRLTAKPVYQDTTKPHFTADLEMASLGTKYPLGSLDQMKAIQSVIDSRRAMGSGVTTFSPLATYAGAEDLLPYLPSNNPNLPMDRETHYRRMMAPSGRRAEMYPDMPPMSAARLAVPDPVALTSQFNWNAMKDPAAFVDPMKIQDFYLSTPTYPPPFTVLSGVVRPKTTTDHNPFQEDVVTFSLNTQYFRKFLTSPAPKAPVIQEKIDNLPETYHEKISNDLPSKGEDVKPLKVGGKPTEEEYEDEIKGLPVRKRRSIRNPSEENIIHPVSNERSTNDESYKHIFKINIQPTSYGMDSNNGNNFTIVNNQTVVEEINDPQNTIQTSNENNTNQQMNTNVKQKSDLENKIEIIRKLDLIEDKKEKSLFDRLVAFIKTKADSLKEIVGLNEETSRKASLVTAKNKIKTRRKSFESKIVSSKYIPHNVRKRLSEAEQLSNQEILDSVSVNFNEANLFKNSSSTLIKFLQATLTA